MSTIKVYALGGLDQKANDLTRQIDKASDMLNLEYNTQTTIKKRNGYEIDQTKACNDMVYFPSKDEKLFFTANSSNVDIVGDGYTKTLTMPSTLNDSVNISSAENTLSLYFTNSDFSIPVMKYDGSNIYRAGLPTPRKANDAAPTMVTNLGFGATRIFYSFKDINGLTIFSPYFEFEFTPQNTTVITANTLVTDSTCEANGFLNRYAWTAGAYQYYVNPASDNTAKATADAQITRTLTVNRHNYIVGDKFLFDSQNRMLVLGDFPSTEPSFKTFIILEVESVTSTSITFKKDLTINHYINVNKLTNLSARYPTNTTNTEFPIDIRTKLHVYCDFAKSGVFTEFCVASMDGSSVSQSIYPVNTGTATFSLSPITSDALPTYLEDIYDTASSKIMPPFCKYIASYGDQIVYANIQSYINFNNRKTQYNNNDLIIYSDILQGDCCESTSEFNRQKIGETYDGEITAVSRCNDSVIVFKTNSTFTLDGVLSAGQYSIRKINTNGVGCQTHKAIVATDEGLFFQAHNGIYFTNGINIQRITYELDAFFGSGDYSGVRAARLKKKQKTLFYIPTKNKTVVIDYYYNQVYLWDNITPTSGFIEDKNGVVYFNDGAKLYVFSDTYHDTSAAGAEVAINAYYSTTWHHCGEPALRKKFIDMRIFALTSDTFDLTIKTQTDWSDPDNTYNTPTVKTTKIKSFSSADQTAQYVLDMLTSRSLRVKFSNNIVNQNMVLTGYEINYEPYNVRDKN